MGVQLKLYAQAFSTDGEPPAEFRLFSQGANRYLKQGMDEPGEIVFDDVAAKAVMALYAQTGRKQIALDYDHSTFNPNIQIKRAAGWFTPEVRNGELWATNVEWTERATKLLKSKELRYYSPTVMLDEDNRPTWLRPVALTNDPASFNQPALLNATTKLEKPKMAEDEKAAAEAAAKAQELQNTLLAMTGKTSVGEAIGTLSAMKAQSEQLQAMSAQLEQLRAEKETTEIEGIIEDAIKSKRISADKRPELVKLAAEHGKEALRGYVALMQPKVVPIEAAPGKVAETLSASGLPKAQLKMLKAIGLSVEKFKEHEPKYRQMVNPSDEEI